MLRKGKNNGRATGQNNSRNHNLKISKAPLKRQAHQRASLFTGAEGRGSGLRNTTRMLVRVTVWLKSTFIVACRQTLLWPFYSNTSIHCSMGSEPIGDSNSIYYIYFILYNIYYSNQTILSASEFIFLCQF